jgi:hypothetical protein
MACYTCDMSADTMPSIYFDPSLLAAAASWKAAHHLLRTSSRVLLIGVLPISYNPDCRGKLRFISTNDRKVAILI